MSRHPSHRRYAVLTPGATGSDGISELSRLVIRAVAGPGDGAELAAVDVLSLGDPPGASPVADAARGVRFFGAGGRKSHFMAAAVRALGGARCYTGVLCLHLHLSPVAGLLAAGGARLTTVLCGIESWKPLRKREYWALARSQLLLAISHHTARRFLEAHPDFRPRELRVCHLAVRPEDGPALGPASDSRSVHCQGFALIVGRMMSAERYKGHDALIDLWPRVVAEVPAAHLVVVGDGDDRPRLEAKASSCRDHITFLGRLPDAALAQLYRECLFFVMPSRDEGFGLVFLEAMTAGKACIGGLGAAEEVIDDGVTGLVVDPSDAEDIFKAVVRLFSDPVTRARMGTAGAARVAREFTEAHFRRRFLALLEIQPG